MSIRDPITPPPARLRRSNAERRETTQAALVAAARRSFVAKGYALTGTPELVAAAHVTRGALYHHFADKADLLMAVCRQMAEEVAAAIVASGRPGDAPRLALHRGALAYFDAMAAEGRARLLLVEAPTVLDAHRMRQLADLSGRQALEDGLRAAAGSGRAPIAALAALVSAAFDRAALAIAMGESAAPYQAAIGLLIDGIVDATRR